MLNQEHFKATQQPSDTNNSPKAVKPSDIDDKI